MPEGDWTWNWVRLAAGSFDGLLSEGDLGEHNAGAGLHLVPGAGILTEVFGMGNRAPIGLVAAVVFDAVGTLIDPRPSVAEAYAMAAQRQGVRLELREVRARFREAFGRDESDEARGPMSTDERVEHRRWRRIVSAVLPEVPDPGRAFEELWEHFARASAWRCFDDAGPAVLELKRAGIEVVVGSNFDNRLRSVLSGLEPLSGLADSAIISSEVGYRKPHECFYRTVCERLGMEPERIVFVGDDPLNDLEGPRQAGLKSILVDRHGVGGQEATRLRDLRELPDRLRMV